MNKEVAGYINRQKAPQKEICKRLRSIILETFPGIDEEIWAGAPFYGRRYYIAVLKDHVNMGFAVNGLSQKQMDLFEGKGRMMRHLKFFSLKDVDEAKIVRLLKVSRRAKRSC